MTGPVAVTGAGGFLGSRLLAELRDSGIEARPVVRPGRSAFLEPCVGVVEADLRDAPSLVAAFRGCAGVIHAAALMRGAGTEVWAVNAEGTRNALEAALRCGVRRLVFVSTVAVYGRGDLREIVEEHPLAPRGSYATSKAAAEAHVREVSRRGDLETRILRPCTVYGQGDRVFTPYLLQLARQGTVPLYRKGEVRFDLVAVADLARAGVLAATQEGGRGEAFHVTSGERLTVGRIVALLRERLGFPVPAVEMDDPTSPPPGVPEELARELSEDRSFSIERARRILGYQPRVRFPSGVGVERSGSAGGPPGPGACSMR